MVRACSLFTDALGDEKANALIIKIQIYIGSLLRFPNDRKNQLFGNKPLSFAEELDTWNRLKQPGQGASVQAIQNHKFS
jgi:hypothetical protein